MPPDSSPPIRMSPSIIRSAMYLNPMGVSCSVRPYFAAMRSSMRVVLKARTTSPGHFLRTSSQRSKTQKILCESTKLPSPAPADTICVTVCSQAGVALLANHRLLQHRRMRFNRLGIDPGKQRIQFLTNRHILHSALGKYSREHAASRTIHRIHSKLKLRFRDEVQVGKTANGCDVGLLEVDFLNGGLASFRRSPGSKFFLDLFHDCGRSRAPEFALELYPVPFPGSVARAPPPPPRRALMFHRVRNRGRGRVIVGKLHRDPGSSNDFGHNLRRAR